MSWVKYLKRVQFEKNTTFHSTVGMTPYEALYHHKPSYGLSDFGIPVEYGSDIHSEQQLDALIEEINAPPTEDNVSNVSPHPTPSTTSSDIPTNSYDVGSVVFQELPKDSYLDDISQPIPDGTHIFGSDLSPSNLNCVVCNFETSGAHYCPECNGFVHVYCGRTEGEESYGSPVYCNKCEVANATRQTDSIVAGIKMRQDKLHDRMLVSAAKKFCPANIGDNVVVPIERPDKMTSLGPRNMLGVVTDITEGSYTIGTRDGTVSTNYTRNQFDVCSSNIFLQPSSVPAVTIPQTSAMRNASLGIDTNSCCRCSHCKTNRCACRKSGRSCGTKYHMGAKCFNC